MGLLAPVVDQPTFAHAAALATTSAVPSVSSILPQFQKIFEDCTRDLHDCLVSEIINTCTPSLFPDWSDFNRNYHDQVPCCWGMIALGLSRAIFESMNMLHMGSQDVQDKISMISMAVFMHISDAIKQDCVDILLNCELLVFSSDVYSFTALRWTPMHRNDAYVCSNCNLQVVG